MPIPNARNLDSRLIPLIELLARAAYDSIRRGDKRHIKATLSPDKINDDQRASRANRIS
jgi:hypothetical protein